MLSTLEVESHTYMLSYDRQDFSKLMCPPSSKRDLVTFMVIAFCLLKHIMKQYPFLSEKDQYFLFRFVMLEDCNLAKLLGTLIVH